MEENKNQYVKIELWDGFSVDGNKAIANDVDFMIDMSKAVKNEDFAEIINLTMALVGGENTYNKIRKHLLESTGQFSMDDLGQIIDKITTALFPKAGKSGSKRSWANMTK